MTFRIVLKGGNSLFKGFAWLQRRDAEHILFGREAIAREQCAILRLGIAEEGRFDAQWHGRYPIERDLRERPQFPTYPLGIRYNVAGSSKGPPKVSLERLHTNGGMELRIVKYREVVDRHDGPLRLERQQIVGGMKNTSAKPPGMGQPSQETWHSVPSCRAFGQKWRGIVEPSPIAIIAHAFDRRVHRQALTEMPCVAAYSRQLIGQRIDRQGDLHHAFSSIQASVCSRSVRLNGPMTCSSFSLLPHKEATSLVRTKAGLTRISIS